MEFSYEQNTLQGKGKLGICAELLAGVSAKSNSSSNTKAGEDVVVVAASVPRFRIILLGKNWGAGEKPLRNKVFVLTGFFDKVNSHRPTAEEEIKTMIALFDGEIKRSFFNNTKYLLAGKNADPKKIKGAQERQVEIINLR